MDTRERRRTRGVVGPVILIVVGVLFLLGNLGLVSWNAWEIIVRLWPVLLIAFGLEILIGRRSTVASLIVLLITLVIIGAALYWMPAQFSLGAGTSTETIIQPIEGAKRANIRIAYGMGTVNIGALSDPNTLIQGTAAVGAGEQLVHSFNMSGDTAMYSLSSREGNSVPFFAGPTARNWDLSINRDVPTQLAISGGVGTSVVDLSQLHVTNLDVRLGVGKSTITMPSTGQVQASINGGVGDVEVVIPSGMAARIQANPGIGGVNVPSSYQHQDNTYTSPGYDTAQNRVDLIVHGGVGRISVQ